MQTEHDTKINGLEEFQILFLQASTLATTTKANEERHGTKQYPE